MTMRRVAYVGTVALLAQGLLAQGCGGDNSPSTTGATGGVTGTGGTIPVSSDGGSTVPATTGTGGTTMPATGAGGSAGGATGSTSFEPLCGNLVTNANVAPTKNGICIDTDPQFCYKTCGPQSIGFKSETCSGGVYVEQSGCSFPPGDYSCYKVADPFVVDPSCPTDAPPQATTPCSVAPCTLCNLNGGYLDSGGSAKTGYCVCPPVADPDAGTTSKWSCASSTAWPCPAGQGC
jgi:hypothetical protein